MRVTLIHNPASGGGEGPDGEALQSLIRREGHEVTYFPSKDNAWKAALSDPGDLVAVAGGDGTVGKVTRRMVGRGVPVAVLPTGSANNVAATLGLVDAPIARLVADWSKSRRIRFDVGVARGPWGPAVFVEGFGTGLFAELLTWEKTGRAPGGAADGDDKVTSARDRLRKLVQRIPARRLTVHLDDQDLSGQYVLIEAMNTRFIGPSLYLAPDAALADGLIDIALLPEGNRGAFAEYLAGPPGGGVAPSGITVHRGRRLQIEWDGFAVHIDDKPWPGEGATPPTPAAIEVETGEAGLEFLVPSWVGDR